MGGCTVPRHDHPTRLSDILDESLRSYGDHSRNDYAFIRPTPNTSVSMPLSCRDTETEFQPKPIKLKDGVTLLQLNDRIRAKIYLLQ